MHVCMYIYIYIYIHMYAYTYGSRLIVGWSNSRFNNLVWLVVFVVLVLVWLVLSILISLVLVLVILLLLSLVVVVVVIGWSIGWSNSHFNNLHFRIPLKTKEIATCAPEESLRLCICMKRMLLKWYIVQPVQPISLLEEGEGTVDWDTVDSNRLTGNRLPDLDKRISSKSSNSESWARWGFPSHC